MTERLDDARKYIDLYKTAVDNGDKKGSIIYGLRATSILEVIHDTPRDEEEVKDVESLEKEMFPPSIFHLDRDLLGKLC